MSVVTFKIADHLILTQDDKTFLNELPANSPDTKLTKKQIDRIGTIYYTHVFNQIYKGWGTDLAELETREKWPSGNRMKLHEARRIVLNTVLEMNNKCVLNAETAAEYFHSALDCRETYQILHAKGYKVVKGE